MRLWLPLCLCLLAGCAARVPVFPGPTRFVGRHAAPSVPGPADPGTAHEPRSRLPAGPRASSLGPAVARAASYYLHHAPPREFRNDCSGFVCAVLDRVSVPTSGNTKNLWEAAQRAGAIHHHPRPAPGDLAFFDNTYDANGNGAVDDPLTHVAVVLEVAPDGTVLVAHAGTSAGRTTLHLNLSRPHDHVDEQGRVLNDHLRQRRVGDPPDAGWLAGELWRGWARVHPHQLDAWAR
jgi:hypothetical protein